MSNPPNIVLSVQQTIAKYDLIRTGEYVVVGVSGGPDSLALLHILWRLKGVLGIKLHVAHLNHGLRGEDSEADARFVRAFGESLGLPVTIEAVSVSYLARLTGDSLEVAGREARYQFFRRVCEITGAAKVALGHHFDDQAETVLMRVLRGAGPAGLSGIKPIRDGWIIRPLLEVSRKEIEAYCRAEALTPRFDRSNEEKGFTRNKIRHDLLPYLEREFNPAIRRNLVNLARVFQDEEAWLAGLVREHYGRIVRERAGGVVVSDKIKELPVALQRRLLKRVFRCFQGLGAHPQRAELGFDHVEVVLGLLRGLPGKSIDLPGGTVVERGVDGLVFRSKPVAQKALCYSYALKVPGSVNLPEAGLVMDARKVKAFGRDVLGDPEFLGDGKTRVVFDLAGLKLPLSVRNRRKGDYFYPFGLGCAKKIKEYFINEKVPRAARDKVPLVVTGDGQILWVVGFRPDGRFSISNETEECLVLTVRDKAVD